MTAAALTSDAPSPAAASTAAKAAAAKIFAQPNARASPTKGSGKGGNKGGGKGAAGLAGSVPNSFASLKIPDCSAALDGRPAPLTNACELRDGLTGVAQVDHAVARNLAETYRLTDVFSTPCAVLTSTAGSQELFETRTDLVERFAITKITLPVLRGGAPGAKTTEALLFQLGPHSCPVQFKDPTVMHVLGDLDTGTTRGTAYIYKIIVPPNSFWPRTVTTTWSQRWVPRTLTPASKSVHRW